MNVNFIMDSRWLLESEGLEAHSVKSVKFDYAKNAINIEAFEILDGDKIPISEWVDSSFDEKTIKFISLNESGNEIFSRVYTGLTVVKNQLGFSYNSMKPAIRKISIKYQTVT